MLLHKLRGTDFYLTITFGDYSHSNNEDYAAEFKCLLEVVFVVYNFSKNLGRMHRSDGTNRHKQYPVCSYHM